MGIATLSPELKLMIVEPLDFNSAFNFAITCKSHWSLCKRLMEIYAVLCIKYNTININGFGDDRVLWHTAKEVLDEPLRGEFIREINLTSCPSYWDVHVSWYPPAPFTGEIPPENYNESFHRATQIIAHNLSGNSQQSNLASRLQDAMTRGERDCPLVILTYNSPLLKTIRATGLRSGNPFYRFLRRVAIDYATPAMAPRLPFQHLTTVALAHYDTEGGISPDWCRYFICIPSLRAFVGSMVGGGCDRLSDDSEAYEPHVMVGGRGPEKCYDELEHDGDGEERPRHRPILPMSNVEDLMFSHSALHFKKGVENILSGITALRRFYYDGSGQGMVSDCNYSPKRVIKALVRHTGHSLEHLVMRSIFLYIEFQGGFFAARRPDFKRISLRGFTKLKTLTCNWKMIYPMDLTPDEEKTFDLRDILPASLEELQIFGNFSDDEWAAIQRVLVGKNDMTPNLRNVYIERRHGDNPNSLEVARSEGGQKISNEWTATLFAKLTGHGW
ncbi:hypothetical protein B0J11DRAFT_311452 [Dendryphion nanum]|uniref:F-box domain-containing protein n=1 Tax=Dendryphion nanum TaxID=256645 RepID=A0A9P9DS52_9PLEO|nr:hypothetical protein B0J11DRAFT_311452 [Dendryphion nanum]